MSTAHPRSRGENHPVPGTTFWYRGSSPLTRGKPHGCVQGVVARRLIPAHAGKTLPASRWARRARAHPRSRGENLVDDASQVLHPGSSPLTRGKLWAEGRRPWREGLIPAHAGKTLLYGPLLAATWAHPRSRGENPAGRRRIAPQRGSSPLTRGKLSGSQARASSNGLIPAHAGKTVLGTPTKPSDRAHPRSRGENYSHHPTSRRDVGSSPLTRGKREDRRPQLDVERLIPAHAGKT